MSTVSLPQQNPVFHDHSNIDTRFHFLRECVEDGCIEVEFIGTDGQLADVLLTKALGLMKFQELRARIDVARFSFSSSREV